MKNVSIILLYLFTSLSFIVNTCVANEVINNELHALCSEAPEINPEVLELALTAYHHARDEGLDEQQILTVVDYTKPSTVPRLWTFDLNDDSLLYRSVVTHGSGSGLLFPKRFSNVPGSYESSVGLFLTESVYNGKVGYALRLAGLEHNINDNAESRAIVVHGAKYADPSFLDKYGRLGRSEGCFALPTAIYKPVINTIDEGTLIFSYYPDKYWLNHSKYLSPIENTKELT